MKKKRLCSLALAVVMGTLCCTNAFAASHTVVPGDTLSKIAMAYGVPFEDVAAANPQIKDVNLIYPGQTVTVPTASSAGSSATATAPASTSASSGASTASKTAMSSGSLEFTARGSRSIGMRVSERKLAQ